MDALPSAAPPPKAGSVIVGPWISGSADSPADNPMKGLVPDAGMRPERFPHSLESGCIALAEVMDGPEDFDWQPFERRLNEAAGRGCQTVFRVWLEHPGKTRVLLRHPAGAA